jgi:hypothetical protein
MTPTIEASTDADAERYGEARRLVKEKNAISLETCG